MEVGGRWSEKAYHFLDTLAAARGKEAPRALRGSVYQTCKKRWTAFLAVAGMRAFANSLLQDSAHTTNLHEGGLLTVGQLLELDPHSA